MEWTKLSILIGLAAGLALVAAQGFVDWRQLHSPDPHNNSIAGPVKDAAPEFLSYTELMALPIMGVEQKRTDQQKIEQLDAPDTRLELELRGIFFSDNDSLAGAAIAKPREKSTYYSVGETIMDDVVLQRVAQHSVFIQRGDVTEALRFADSEAAHLSNTSAKSPRINGTSGNLYGKNDTQLSARAKADRGQLGALKNQKSLRERLRALNEKFGSEALDK